jgi:predicted NodU family carbamoyl transferase
MNILGVCNANDSGAAVLVNGKLVAAANEERFCRKKAFSGRIDNPLLVLR